MMDDGIELFCTNRVCKSDILRMPEIVEQIAERGLASIVRMVPSQIAKKAIRFTRRINYPQFWISEGEEDVCIEVAAVLVPRCEYLEMKKTAYAARNRELAMHDEIRELRRKLSDVKARRREMRRRGRR